MFSHNLGQFQTLDTYAGNENDPISLHKYLYGHASPVMFVDPSGNTVIGSVFSGFGALTNLIRSSVAAGPKLLKRAATRKKFKVFKGRNIKNVKGKVAGIPIPHFFVYIELNGIKSGFKYDVTVGRNAYAGVGSVGEALNFKTAGGLRRKATNRIALVASGGKLNGFPSARFTIMQFVFWEHTAYRPLVGGFDYCLTGINCSTWTNFSIGAAKLIEKQNWLVP